MFVSKTRVAFKGLPKQDFFEDELKSFVNSVFENTYKEDEDDEDDDDENEIQ